MTSRPALRRVLREAADGGQVSRNAVEVLGRLTDELIVRMADRAVRISVEAGARRVDVEDVLQAWRESIIITDDDDDDGGGPQIACDSPIHASLAPRSHADNPAAIYNENSIL